MTSASTATTRPNYGIDAPAVVRRFLVIAIVCIVTGLLSQFVAYRTALLWIAITGAVLALSGAWFLITAGVMVWGSLAGKMRLRDRVLDTITWRGDERVLDAGCGRGLMLTGAAKRVPNGSAAGLDLWRREDLAGNSADAAMENARLEGVADRVQLTEGDMRSLPFEPQTFNVVLSSWAVHNIPDEAGRVQALREMVRVLKPGGALRIVDIGDTARYAAVLQECGMQDVRRYGRSRMFVLPTYIVSATKPNR